MSDKSSFHFILLTITSTFIPSLFHLKLSRTQPIIHSLLVSLTRLLPFQFFFVRYVEGLLRWPPLTDFNSTGRKKAPITLRLSPFQNALFYSYRVVRSFSFFFIHSFWILHTFLLLSSPCSSLFHDVNIAFSYFAALSDGTIMNTTFICIGHSYQNQDAKSWSWDACIKNKK